MRDVKKKMRGFRMVESWSRLSRAAHFVQATRPLCTSNDNGKAIAEKSIRDFDAYKQLDKLDFMTAAKILFTHPPKQKKFGIDFHLVQLFFVCMPSLAVYLVAQYARYEIRRMEAVLVAILFLWIAFFSYLHVKEYQQEVEVKKKKAEEEEEKAKEMEAISLKEKGEAESDPELFNVKVRLEALEEAVKEIAVEAKKLSSSSVTKHEEGSSKKDKLETVNSKTSESKSNVKNSEAANDRQSKKQLSESKPDLSRESVGSSGSK